MKRHEDYKASLQKLIAYIEKENYSGYDPYDTLLSPFPFRKLGIFASAVATQIQKRNPINIRPLMGIKKDLNPKGLGIILLAYCELHKKGNNYSDQMKFLVKKIIALKSGKYSGSSWGYNFDWASPGKYINANEPNIVVTAFIAKALFEYYLITKDDNIKNELIRIGDFIENDLPYTITRDGMCYSYSVLKKDCCYNASMLAAETLAAIFTITGKDSQKQNSIACAEFVISHQHNDGHWEYSLNVADNTERHQVDFHQGYIIDSLNNIINYLNINSDKYNDAINNAAEFYRNKQFFPDGRSLWRLPAEYPVEIHNQSQGIITFINLEKKLIQSSGFANTIADWTIKNMQDKSGYFYYRKLAFYTNRISFMRWSNAWMMLALSKLVTSDE